MHGSNYCWQHCLKKPRHFMLRSTLSLVLVKLNTRMNCSSSKIQMFFTLLWIKCLSCAGSAIDSFVCMCLCKETKRVRWVSTNIKIMFSQKCATMHRFIYWTVNFHTAHTYLHINVYRSDTYAAMCLNARCSACFQVYIIFVSCPSTWINGTVL